MPILNNSAMREQTLPTGKYGYSATRLDHLGASEYTLVTVVCDVSGSVAAFASEMEAALKEIVSACKLSPRADNLLLRLVTFDDKLKEAHGFKILQECQLNGYDRLLRPGGNTALYDATENAVAALAQYGSQLATAHYDVNAIVFVITDGIDNASKFGARQAREALQNAITGESLESLVSILIGVNVQDASVGAYLQDFKTEAGFTQYVELSGANSATLARLAAFVTKSVYAQSRSLGSGGPSRPLTF